MPLPRLAAIVLAAGRASRMGGGKQLLPWQGKPLLAHSLHLVDSLPQISIKACVLGYQAAEILQALGPQPGWTFLENPHWAKGQSTSLHSGIRWLMGHQEAQHITGALVLLGDMPKVQQATLQALANSHKKAQVNGQDIRAFLPTFVGKRGNPVLVGRDLFPALLEIEGDQGARAVFQTLRKKELVAVQDPGILLDVDTPEEYQKLLAE